MAPPVFYTASAVKAFYDKHNGSFKAKGALDMEHPYGDALDVAELFLESGGEQVMMYNSNYYGVFGVMANYQEYAKVLMKEHQKLELILMFSGKLIMMPSKKQTKFCDCRVKQRCLQSDKLQALAREIDDFTTNWNQTDWSRYKETHPEKVPVGASVPEIPKICINEYANFAECGVPGRLVNWIGRLEDREQS